MNVNMAVKTDDLTKAFFGNEVLHNFNMNVPQGSIYGLLGVNGAGKTTAFKLLLGLLKPTAGTAQVLGLDIVTTHDEILRQVGSIIEVPYFYDHLSAQENLEIHLAYMNTKGDIDGTLKMVGLKSANQPVSEFSLGMRQRLALARAIIHRPKLLVLDEPINGLDPIGIRDMRELFLKLNQEQGITILISSHILSEIEHVAGMVGVIANGMIAQEVELAAIKEKYPDGLEDYFFSIMGGENHAETDKIRA